MSWIRNLSRKIFPQYFSSIPQKQAEKWLAVSRVTYFFAAGTLVIMLYGISQEHSQDEQEKKDLLMGRPVVKDSSFLKSMIRSGNDAGVVHEYDKEKGWIVKEYHREEYQQKLEREAYRRAYEAQKEELEAGRPLPPGALVLVDEKDVKREPKMKTK